jgi:hypothetical protein
VIIQWVLPDDATGVNVFREPPPPAGAWITGRISRDGVIDQSCEPNTLYTYRVCAYYGTDEGVCSEKLARRADMCPWFDLGILSESSR